MLTRIYTHTVPVEITQTKLGISNDYKQQLIKEIYRLGDSQSQKTNVKAIMTNYKIWEQSNVFDLLINRVIECHKTMGYLDSNSGMELKLINCWGAIYKKGHYTKQHIHIPAIWSWVYYLKSNGKTPLVFSKSNFSLDLYDDDLVIFPSYVPHEVPKHDGEEDRICLAGNFEFTT